jgi:hypothetical protein
MVTRAFDDESYPMSSCWASGFSEEGVAVQGQGRSDTSDIDGVSLDGVVSGWSDGSVRFSDIPSPSLSSSSHNDQ